MGNLTSYNDYLSKIIQFNSDSTLIALREKYSMPSFFEIISKERSETTYSAFLKWLFQEKHTDGGVANPVLLLLNAIVHRSEQQNKASGVELINDTLKNSIVTSKLKILKTKAKLEKPVRELAKEILNDSSTLTDDRKAQLQDLADNCQDSIDIFMECDIESEEVSAKKLQIIIENKIDSAEGGSKNKNNKNNKLKDQKYIKAHQTTRYYIGTHRNDGDNVLQIYVYLTPLPSRKLDSFKELLIEQNSDKKTKSNKVVREDDHFIQINYQDVVNGVVQPLLSSLSLSSRSRFFLEEFVNQLTFPSIEGNKVYQSIAVSNKYSAEFTKLWDEYKDLVIDAAIAASQSNFWTIGDYYYDYQPKDKILNEILRLFEGKAMPKDIASMLSNNNIKISWKKRTWYKKIESNAKPYLDTKQVVLDIEDDVMDLLSSFWEENKRFLFALMDGIKDNERVKVECLLKEASKRDTTKYYVYFNDQLLNDDGKPTGKGVTAHIIIKKWAELYNNENGEYPSIDKLRQTFPKEIHAYYKNGTWFKNLFYLFKNENGVFSYRNDDKNPSEWEEATDWKWDFDFKERFYIPTSEPEHDVILLKMWRKDNLEKLIKHAKEKNLFDGKLRVEEAIT